MAVDDQIEFALTMGNAHSTYHLVMYLGFCYHWRGGLKTSEGPLCKGVKTTSTPIVCQMLRMYDCHVGMKNIKLFIAAMKIWRTYLSFNSPQLQAQPSSLFSRCRERSLPS